MNLFFNHYNAINEPYCFKIIILIYFNQNQLLFNSCFVKSINTNFVYDIFSEMLYTNMTNVLLNGLEQYFYFKNS